MEGWTTGMPAKGEWPNDGARAAGVSTRASASRPQSQVMLLQHALGNHAVQVWLLRAGPPPAAAMAVPGADGDASALVSNVLRSPGRPLDPGPRELMEARFAQDFSDVRIHTDPRAAESADAISARAYTSGRDIVFRAGAYQPESAEGQHLIAHELAHVVQQTGTGASRAPAPATTAADGLQVSNPGDLEEREAELAADRIGRGGEAPSAAVGAAVGGPAVIARAESQAPPVHAGKLAVRAKKEPPYPDPEQDEAALDRTIKSLQQQDLKPPATGKRLGTVSFKNLPAMPAEGEGGKVSGPKAKVPKAAAPTSDLLRRAAKTALLDVVAGSPSTWAGMEYRLRVPINPPPEQADYAMVILRFDPARNTEVELAGVDLQAKGYVGEASAPRDLDSLASSYGVTFVSDAVTALLPGQPKAIRFDGKPWSADDVRLMSEALPLLGATEQAVLRGVTFRRLDAEKVDDTAGFYHPADDSVNLMDAALPIGKEIWLGGPQKFFSYGVFAVLHEIAHALDDKRKGSKKAPGTLDEFKKAVFAESKRLAPKGPGKGFPPAGITLPTDYSAKGWAEFFADAAAIYWTTQSYLDSPIHKYLLDFFRRVYP